MNINEIRRLNMLKLMQKFKTQVAFAEKIERDPSQISQIKKGEKRNGDPIVMGDKLARHIETKLELKNGWMDVLERQEISNSVVGIKVGSGGDMVTIPHYDAKMACGDGYYNGDYPDMVEEMEVSKSFLRRLGLPTNGDGVVSVKAVGDSMQPEISDGDRLIINTKEVDFELISSGKIYAFNWGGDMICKRVYREGAETIVLRSDNQDKQTYPNRTLKKDDIESVNLFGRVKYVSREL